MKKLKFICIFLTIALLLSACSVNGENTPNIDSGENTAENEQQTASPPQEDNTTPTQPAETTPLTTTAEETTSETAANPIPPNEYTDEKGFLTEKGIASIDRILNDNKSDTGSTYTGLFDFDGDNIPEVYLVYHNGGQGLMPVEIFDLTGKRLGEFQGYCRDGYTKLSRQGDTVYVINFYEHSAHQRLNRMDKITLSEGELHTELYFEARAAAAGNFPLLETVYYYKDGEERQRSDPEEQEREWGYRFYDSRYEHSLMENEASICACDFSDRVSYEEMAEKTVEVYNLYLRWRQEAAEILEKDGATLEYIAENFLFYFDDFDGDGENEAFFCVRGSKNMYFINGSGYEKIEPIELQNEYYEFYRIESLLVAQPFGNSAKCRIFGVREGKWYEPESSFGGMCLDYAVYGPEVGTFFLHKSKYDASSHGGGHTWKPYLFYTSGEEIEGVPIERSELSAVRQGEALLAELERLEEEGFTICEIFCFLDKYYVVNYIMPVWGENENGEMIHYTDINRYNWYLAWNTFDTIMEKEEGRYIGGSIRDELEVISR